MKIHISDFNSKEEKVFYRIAKLIDSDYIRIDDFDVTRTDYGVYLNGDRGTYPIRIYLTYNRPNMEITKIERLSDYSENEGWVEIHEDTYERIKESIFCNKERRKP